MAASIGAALGCLTRKGYGDAMFWVVSCALNHYCYNGWNRRIKDNKQ